MDCQATSPLVFMQPELVPAPAPVSWPAQRLLPAQRRGLAVQVLAGTHPVAELARQHQVSRKFLYQQADTATQALALAFDPAPVDDEVLFYLPVTKAWLRQLVLALVLICHSPYRAVVELLRDLFDWEVSLGTVHNIVHHAVEPARAISRHRDLAGVRIGAHDEIFQAGHPVLVGVDTASTYCYLLSLEDHRDAETWGVRLLELVDQGFDPEATVADAGGGLRAGQALALPEVPCRGDVFHILHDLEGVAGYLENRAYGAIEATQRRRRQLDGARRHDGRGRAKSLASAAQLLRRARAASDTAVALSDDVATLIGWLRHDVLAVAGPCSADRRLLYDFVLAEWKSRAPLCPHRLGPVCRQLENQRDDLLAFAPVLDEKLEQLGQEFQVPAGLLRPLLSIQGRDDRDPRRWSEEAAIRARLRGRFHEVQAAVAAVARGTVRASSLVENLNSRLRGYFFLRRHLGPDYLALLQFFLNHRRLERSDHPERVGKTPAELLTGQSHRTGWRCSATRASPAPERAAPIASQRTLPVKARRWSVLLPKNRWI
jgi:hypothetical protein